MTNASSRKTMLICCLILGTSVVCLLWTWSFPLAYLVLQIYIPIKFEKKGGWRLLALLPLLVGVPAIAGLAAIIVAASRGIIHPDGLWPVIALLPYMALGVVLLYYFILLVVRYASRKTRMWADWEEALSDIRNPAILAFFEKEILNGQDCNLEKRYLRYEVEPNQQWFLVARPRDVFALQESRVQGDLEFWRGGLSQPDETKLARNGPCLRFLLSTKEDFRFFLHSWNKELMGLKWIKTG